MSVYLFLFLFVSYWSFTNGNDIRSLLHSFVKQERYIPFPTLSPGFLPLAKPSGDRRSMSSGSVPGHFKGSNAIRKKRFASGSLIQPTFQLFQENEREKNQKEPEVLDRWFTINVGTKSNGNGQGKTPNWMKRILCIFNHIHCHY